MRFLFIYYCKVTCNFFLTFICFCFRNQIHKTLNGVFTSVWEGQISHPDGRETRPSVSDIKMPLRPHKCFVDPRPGKIDRKLYIYKASHLTSIFNHTFMLPGSASSSKETWLRYSLHSWHQACNRQLCLYHGC